VTDLAGTQITSLMETLPGIAHVLRSPVADAFVSLIRAGSGQGAFNLSDADEVMKYAVRRNLLATSEAERVLAEAREALAAAAAAAKAKAPKAAPANAEGSSRPARKPTPPKKPAPAKKPAKRPVRKPAKPPVRKPAKAVAKKPAKPAKKPAPKK
jgi:outer membrane biosynthesis protein TonB